MKNLLIIIIVLFSFSTVKASEVSEWFEKESSQFLELIYNNEGTESDSYEKYKYFISKNFAVKSIAYGLIGESIIDKSSKNELTMYLNVFTDYLITTIYKLAKSNSSSSFYLSVAIQ